MIAISLSIKRLLRTTLVLSSLFLLFYGLADHEYKASAVSNSYFKAFQNNITVYDNSSGRLVPIGKLTEGEVYKYTANDGNWLRIKVGGENAYIWKDATRPASPSGVKNWIGNVSSNHDAEAIETLTVYDNTSGSLVPFGTIEKGTKFKYVKQEGRWLIVDYAGRKGYVYEPATKKPFRPGDRYFEALQSNITVYDNSTGKLVPIGKLTKGEVYELKAQAGNWLRIKVWGKDAYIWKDATRPASSSGVKNWIGKVSSPYGAEAVDLLTVYDNTSGRLVPFGTIEKGTKFKYVKQEGSWLVVEFGGRKGYVYEPATKKQFLPGDRYFEAMQSNITVYDNSTGILIPIGMLTKGEVYEFTADLGNWLRMKVWGRDAYIWKDATRPANRSSAKNWSNQTGKLNARSKVPLSVYDNTSGTLVEFGKINEDVNFKYIKQSGNWMVINFGGREGYVWAPSVIKEKVIKKTYYDYTFDQFVDIQMKANPKSDGAGNINATREQVAYYANPSNFPENSDEFYQFLDLSSPAGLNPTEINEKILRGKGILEGQGKAFVDAAYKYNLNEIYLIAHTLHETSNGTSTLAKGIPVDRNGNVTRDSKGKIAKTAATAHIVYNMYGYGAVDDDPINGGAKYAFDKKWFTPYDAIVGGAEQVGKNYIQKGQNTLYKMRWNPDKPGTHQYATHVMWAVIQTRNIASYYKLIDDYILIFDVPQFKNQPPASSGPPSPPKQNEPSPTPSTEVTYPKGVYGIVSVDNLNFRSQPTTKSSTLTSPIANGTKVEVLGKKGNWYKIKYDNKVGWVNDGTEFSKTYVNLLNLLEVTASALNVRSTPDSSVNNNILGSPLPKGKLVAAVLDENNNVIRHNQWYQIYYNDGKAWVSGGVDGAYIKEIK